MKHVHLIGIGGTGLSAIARILLESGYRVSGSDQGLSPAACDLAARGVKVFHGHAGTQINSADVVIRSSAIPDDNSEVLAARQKGIPVLKRSEFLGQLFTDRTGIAIAGTHGKTTTTSMVAWMLTSMGLDPSFIIGGVSKNLGSNAHAGSGKPFIIEADEYDYMFMGINPQIAVVTNVEYDHPDCFPSEAVYQQAFERFIGSIIEGGVLITCMDNPGSAALERKITLGRRVFTYGTYPASNYLAMNLELNTHGCYKFDVNLRMSHQPGTKLATTELQVPGEHNVRNAVAALAIAHQLDLSLADASRSLLEYQGAERRFDIKAEINGITIVDDYAHHPSEIKTTLQAARCRFPDRRIWVVWQPHTYSRTRTLFNEFIEAFHSADKVIVTEIYPSRERKQNYSAAEIVKSMHHSDVRFIPELDSVVDYLSTNLKKDDIILILSAGDADQISIGLIKALGGKS